MRSEILAARSVGVAVADLGEIGDQRFGVITHGTVRHHRQREAGTPVVGLVGVQNLGAAGGAAGQLDGEVDGFAAGDDGVRGLEPAGRALGQFLGQLAFGFAEEEEAAEVLVAHGPLGGRHDRGVAVPETERSAHAPHVEVAAAAAVGEVWSLRPPLDEQEAEVVDRLQTRAIEVTPVALEILLR